MINTINTIYANCESKDTVKVFYHYDKLEIRVVNSNEKRVTPALSLKFDKEKAKELQRKLSSILE